MVAHTLQTAGFIRDSRGKIQFVNVEAVRESACECYELVKSHYEALLGHNRRASS